MDRVPTPTHHQMASETMEMQISEEETEYLARIKKRRQGECPDVHSTICGVLDTVTSSSTQLGPGFSLNSQQQRRTKSADTAIKSNLLLPIVNEQLARTNQTTINSLMEEMHQAIADFKGIANEVRESHHPPDTMPQPRQTLRGKKSNAFDVLAEEKLGIFITFYKLTCQMLKSCQELKRSNPSISGAQNNRLIEDKLRDIQNINDLLKSQCNYEIPSMPRNQNPSVRNRDHRSWDSVVSLLEHIVVEMKKTYDNANRKRVTTYATIPQQLGSPVCVPNPKKRDLVFQEPVSQNDGNETGHPCPIRKIKLRKRIFQYQPSFEQMNTNRDGQDDQNRLTTPAPRIDSLRWSILHLQRRPPFQPMDTDD